MITTTRDGRNLVIHVEGLDDPYVVPPLPGNGGMQITQTYLGVAGGGGTAVDLANALMMAIDGGTHDTELDQWVPLPEDQRINYSRIGNELSQAEAEDIMSAAFFWQTALGDHGVSLFLEGGGGPQGAIRALSALRARGYALARRDTSAAVAAGAAAPTDRKLKKRKK